MGQRLMNYPMYSKLGIYLKSTTFRRFWIFQGV